MASTTADKKGKKPLVGASGEELQRLLSLLRGVDTVELKVTVPESAQVTTVRALGMDPLEAQLRQVFFFDTPDLALEQIGLVVRARRTQGKRDDTVVKLRPVVPDELPRKLRQDRSFGVELDASPEGFVVSGSMKGTTEVGRVRDAVLGGKAISKLFSREQRALYAERAPTGGALDDLTMLGPILVMKLKYAPTGFARRLVGEVWLYPDGTRILELSTKCAPSEAFQVAAESRGYLTSRGVDLDADQQTKTRTALEFFSRAAQGESTAATAT